MLAALGSLKALTVRPLEEVKYPESLRGQVISVMLPIPTNSMNPYGVLLFWVDGDMLAHLIAPIEQQAAECTLIFDGTGQCVYALNAAQMPLTSIALVDFVNGQETDGASLVTLSGQDYIYASASEGTNGWRTASLVSIDPLMDDMRALRANLVLILGVLILTSIVIIAFAVRIHYRPIQSLASKAEQYVLPEDHRDAFERVHHALDHLNRQASTLRENLPQLREQRLYALLGGQYDSFDSLNRAAGDVGIHFSLPHLCVTVIRTDAPDPLEVLEYLETMESALPSGVEGYYLWAFNRRDMLFLSASQTEKAVLVYMQDIAQDIAATQQCRIQAVIGPQVQSPGDVNTSYSDATAGLEKMVLMGRYGVEVYHKGRHGSFSMPTRQLYRLDMAVLRQEGERVREAVEALLGVMGSEQHSAMMIQTVYVSAMSTLLRGMDGAGLAAQPYEAWLVPELTLTFEEITRRLREAAASLAEGIAQGRQAPQEITAEEMKAYIQAHCLAYDFSVQSAAAHFGLSYSAFSHTFKRKLGVGCKQYVDETRAEAAIGQIMHTDDSLDVIAQRVGFANASSFIRSFKKVTGKTPGSYRNL